MQPLHLRFPGVCMRRMLGLGSFFHSGFYGSGVFFCFFETYAAPAGVGVELDFAHGSYGEISGLRVGEYQT